MPLDDAANTEQEQVLRSWVGLNDALRVTASYRALLPLLNRALAGRFRWQVVERVYGRLSLLRKQEELAELREGRMPESLKG